MDRRQMIAQVVRQFFGDRIDDVRDMVRQDRQELRSWQEPAHIRAVLRRSAARQEGASNSPSLYGGSTLVETEFGPSSLDAPGQAPSRPECLAYLEAGAAGLDKAGRGNGNDLTPEETLGLECILLLYGRPAVLVNAGRLASVPPFWNLLEDQREDIERLQRGVGRIELLGHPEYDWAGTGFLAGENVLLTSRRTAELFAEQRGGTWQFRPGISAWMNYRSNYQDVASAGYRVRGLVGVHDRYDLALLEVERPQVNGSAPTPLPLAALPPDRLEGRAAYVVGYPVRDARRNEPEAVAQLFREVFNVKRVQPGELRGVLTFAEAQFLRFDAAPLGQNAGAPLIDLETQQVLGLATTSRYLEGGTAVPLYQLREDPLFRRAGILFAESSPRDRQSVLDQIERLSRSRFWNEARSQIDRLYQRAFGRDESH